MGHGPRPGRLPALRAAAERARDRRAPVGGATARRCRGAGGAAAGRARARHRGHRHRRGAHRPSDAGADRRTPAGSAGSPTGRSSGSSTVRPSASAPSSTRWRSRGWASTRPARARRAAVVLGAGVEEECATALDQGRDADAAATLGTALAAHAVPAPVGSPLEALTPGAAQRRRAARPGAGVRPGPARRPRGGRAAPRGRRRRWGSPRRRSWRPCGSRRSSGTPSGPVPSGRRTRWRSCSGTCAPATRPGRSSGSPASATWSCDALEAGIAAALGVAA